jgi:regulator of sigma E protease
MIGQLILSLSILIVLHEMGHFFPARLFDTRVEKFYLFFDPWFSLFKFKKGETEYGIGWLPLGGYVKISGMIDESMDKEQMKLPPQPWEFRSKPAWQRLIIMLGGVTVNFILGFFILGMVLFVWGEEYLPNKNVEYGIQVDTLGMNLGLQNGDKIISVGDVPFEKFSDRYIFREIIINEADELKINRAGKEMTLPITDENLGELTSRKNKGRMLFGPRLPFVVQTVVDSDDSPAKAAGIKKGDRIIAANGSPTTFYDQFYKISQERKGQDTEITVVRAQNDTLSLNLKLTEDGKVGVYREGTSFFFETERQEYSFFQALPLGTKKGWSFLTDQVKAFGHMFSGKLKASDSLGGFGSIAKLYGTTWVWENFWRMTAIISLILAFMNLLPIPALDGGHVMFLLYEVVSGRKPSDKVMEYSTIAGFFLIMSLLVFANGLDFLDWIKSF